MKKLSVKVSGSIIEELSLKIPSNIFALNELIKNAYDAFASSVDIKIDVNTKKIEIQDNGYGMDDSNIEHLFHIAKSKKDYGESRSYKGMSRLTQGSKGLGFLAVFKFGEHVKWITEKDGVKSTFSIMRSDLVNMNNVTDYSVDITQEKSSGKGTKIIISSDREKIMELVEYLKEEKNSLKLVGAFLNENIDIKIHLPGENIISSKNLTPQSDISISNQIFFVKYDSSEGVIKFFNNGIKVEELTFYLSSDKYSILSEITIFKLPSRGKEKISKYYYRDFDDALTPLIFINEGLFNNYVIFDSNIYRQTRVGKSLPQMIGFLNVACSNKDLDFNSDRTNFVENELTRKIKEDIKSLNMKIQETGSVIKKKLEDSGRVLLGPAHPKKESDKPTISPAKIEIDKNNLVFYIPSGQINLDDFIIKATDSSGKNIEKTELMFSLDGVELKNRVISSVTTECRKNLVIKYEDKATGLLSVAEILSFNEPRASITGVGNKPDLFYLPSRNPYEVKIPFVSTVISQISDAYRFGSKYNALIASSLRTVFELSVDYLKTKHRCIFIKSSIQGLGSLERDVICLVLFLKKNKVIKTMLEEKLNIGFHTLDNILSNKSSFQESVTEANLGAHKSLGYLNNHKIEFIAKNAALVAVFCDALFEFSNTEISAGTNVDVSDF